MWSSHHSIEGESRHRNILRTSVNIKMLAASIGFDIARVIWKGCWIWTTFISAHLIPCTSLKSSHKCPSHVPRKPRVFAIGLLGNVKAQIHVTYVNAMTYNAYDDLTHIYTHTHTRTHLVSPPAWVSKNVDDRTPAAKTSVECVGAMGRSVVVLHVQKDVHH